MHPATWRAEWRRHDVNLTVTEYKVVSKLAAENGEPVTFRAIYDEMHYQGFNAGSGERGYEVNVRAIMKNIRRKFAAVDDGFDRIRNVTKLAICGAACPGRTLQGAPRQTLTLRMRLGPLGVLFLPAAGRTIAIGLRGCRKRAMALACSWP